MKNDKEVIAELVELIAAAVSQHIGASALFLKPALNVVELKTAQMTDDEAEEIVNKIHWLSRHAEKQTGRLSPYHGAVDGELIATKQIAN